MEQPIVSPRPVFSRTRSSPSVPGSPKAKPRASPSTAALLSIPLPVLIFDSSLLLHSVNQAGRRAFRISKYTGLAPDVTSFVCAPNDPSTSTEPLLPVESVKRELQKRSREAAASNDDDDWLAESAHPIDLRSFEDGSTFRADAIVTEFWPERPSRPMYTTFESASSIHSSDKGSSRGSSTPNAERDSFFPATAATGPWFCLMLVKRHTAPTRPQPHLVLPRQPLLGEQAVSETSTGSSEVSSAESDVLNWPERSVSSLSARSQHPRLADLPSPITPPLSSTGTASSKGSSLLSRTALSSASSARSASIPSPHTQTEGNNESSMGISVSSAGIQLSTSVPPTADVTKVSAAQSAIISHALPQQDTAAVASPDSIASTAIGTEAQTTPSAAAQSGRPTSLPPLPAARDVPAPSDTELFQLASLRSLPRTGVIIADSSIQKGYVNALARELLMGIPASETGSFNWWDEGIWYANDGLSAFESSSGSKTAASGSATTGSTSFFPGSPRGERPNPIDRDPLTHRGVVRAGEGKMSGKAISISKPSGANAVHLAIANILTRSLLSTVGALKPANNSDKEASDNDEGLPRQPDKTAWQEAKAFLPAGVGPGKKPYKMWDASFSQRITDPLEPLLEMCARRGEQPGLYEDEESTETGAVCGMVVGVEVEVISNESGFEKQSSGRRKRVRRRLIQIDGAPIHMDGLHWGGVITLRDVTDERKREVQQTPFEKGGKSTETHFKQILDQMPQMVWTTTPLGSHNFFNVQWYDYTGLEPEESLGVGWQNPFHEEDTAKALIAWKHSLETGDPYTVEYRCRRYDGAWRWMLGRALPYRDMEGNIKGWFGTCTDVDDFVRLRGKLAKTQEQMTAILKGASILIWVVDRDCEFTFFEGQGKQEIRNELNGGKRLEGSHLSAVWRKDPPYEAVQKIFAGELARADVTWRVQDEQNKERWTLQCSLTPYTESRPDGTLVTSGVIFVATDITELTLAQERLEASMEERSRLRASEIAAKEASRLKSDYLMATSHEIRTPIAGMIGMAELLLSEANLTDSNRVAIGKILRSGEILLEMVGMVLDMGKVEAGKLDLENRPFLLEEIITDARIFSIAADKKGLRFVEDVPPLYASHVMGDMPRLRQVISNLLSNAIKFTAKGSVTLRVRQTEDRGKVNLTFQVIDTGIGIRRESIPALFQPFHQAETSTSRLYGGTGLGLAICKNLIDLMGGKIELESEYSKGTTMTVSVPLEKAPEGLLSSLSSPENATGSDILRESIRILVADDNELIREIITKTLKKMRFQVRSAVNGLEVLNAVEREHVDLILMDGQMPEMDGYEATRQLRRSNDSHLQRIKIVALTASAVQGDEEKCLAAGMDAYLTKPVRAATLERTILEQLAKIPSLERGSPSWRNKTASPAQSQSSEGGSAHSSSPRSDGTSPRPPTLHRSPSSSYHFASLAASSSAAAAMAAAIPPTSSPSLLESEKQGDDLTTTSVKKGMGEYNDDKTSAAMALAAAPDLERHLSSSTSSSGARATTPTQDAVSAQPRQQESFEMPVQRRRPSYPGYSSENV